MVSSVGMFALGISELLWQKRLKKKTTRCFVPVKARTNNICFQIVWCGTVPQQNIHFLSSLLCATRYYCFCYMLQMIQITCYSFGVRTYSYKHASYTVLTQRISCRHTRCNPPPVFSSKLSNLHVFLVPCTFVCACVCVWFFFVVDISVLLYSQMMYPLEKSGKFIFLWCFVL